jgi:small-conductance mechanosensitive channel
MFAFRLILFIALCLAAALPAAAQTAAAPAPGPTVDKAQVQNLIGVLENDAERARLVGQLKLMIEAQPAAPAIGSPVEGLSQLAIDTVAVRINRLSMELWAALDFTQAGARISDWVGRMVMDPAPRQHLFDTMLRLALVFGAALLAEALLRIALAQPRAALERRVPSHIWSKAAHLVILALVEVMPLALFAIVANLALPATSVLSANNGTAMTAELMAATLLNGFVLARAVALAARLILAPRAPTLRLPPIGDETAQYLHIWVRRFTDLWIYGETLLDAMLPLGMPSLGHSVLLKLLGLTIATLAIVFILQNRYIVATWLRRGSDKPMTRGIENGLMRLRQALAGVWHGLAIFYIAVIYLVWALNVSDGFPFLVQRSFGTLAVALALWAVTTGLRFTIDRAFAVADELKETYPLLENRANLYLPVLRRVLVAVVWVGGAMVLLQLWGVDSLVWLSSAPGRRLVGMLVTIALAIGLGLLVWEVASAVIERNIRRIDDGEGRNARLRTFLPLLRNVIFVALILIVSLVVLSEIGINIAPLLAGAGVVGLAIGFGSQALVKDVITGMFILFEDTINVGDVVDLDGKSGVVETINLRTIRLRDMTGSQLTIPFSAVTTIKNMTRDFAFYVFDISVAYDQDVASVEAAVMEVDEEMRADPEWRARILAPMEIIGLDKFGDSAMVLKARIKTRPGQQWSVGRQFNRRLKTVFDKAGIEIPYPTSVQFVRGNTATMVGDAPAADVAR